MHHKIDQIESTNKASVFCAWKLARCTHELFIFLRVWLTWSRTKIVTVIMHTTTNGMYREFAREELRHLSYLWRYKYSDWIMATSKRHQGGEVAWLSVINNSQLDRHRKNFYQNSIHFRRVSMGSSSFVSPQCHRLTSYPLRDLGTFTKSEQAHVSYQ